MIIKNFTEHDFLKKYELLHDDKHILNAGSSSIRYGNNCINIDIQSKENVDIVCDIHELPESIGMFDVIICNAVLQYCHDPQKVANEFYRVLKPGGYLYIDAPWIQPYCPDTPDKFRFSRESLLHIFKKFEILENGVTIRPGSAFAMLGVHIAQNLTHNKYLNFILTQVVRIILYPFIRIRTAKENYTAGAFYLICMK